MPAGPLLDGFPFLEVFLPDAEEFWASPGDRTALYSDLWTQNELHFGAIAIAGEQKVLLIECAGAKVPPDQSDPCNMRTKPRSRAIKVAKLNRGQDRISREHEPRNPHAHERVCSEWRSCCRTLQLNDEQREYVRVFRRAGDNLLSVINDILDFSKVEAGQIELENVEFDLADVLPKHSKSPACARVPRVLEVTSRILQDVPPA